MSEKQRNIPYWVLDMVSLFSGVITIMSAVIGAFKINSIVSDLPDGRYQVNINSILTYLVVALIFLLVIVFLQMRKYGQLLQKARKVTTKNYYNFLHDFRNQYFEMIKEHKINSGTNQKHKLEMLTQNTKEYMIKGLNYLCEIVSSAARDEISGCIKVIDNIGGDGKSIDLQKAKIKTFCRSNSTDIERISRDALVENDASVKIVDNTIFYEILRGNSSSYFYQKDLKEYAKKLEAAGEEYKNSSSQYWKYYRGTVVAPIRIAKERLYYEQSNSGFDVIGFLCIDTKSPNVFREKDRVF